MKEVILYKTISNIKKYNNYSDTKLKEIKYGLETIVIAGGVGSNEMLRQKMDIQSKKFV